MRLKKIICLFTALITAAGMMPFLFGSNVSASGEEEYWRSYGNRYYYDQLSESDKKIYDKIDSELMKSLLSQDDIGCVEVDLSSFELKTTTANYMHIRDISLLVQNSNPEYFFFSSRFYTDPLPNQKKSTTYKTLFFDVLPDFVKGADREEAKNEIRAKVEEYLSYIPSDALPEEAEKIIHDRMCDEITYGTYVSDLGTEMDQTIYSASKNLTVCNGYAHLFMSIMNRLGITCIYVRSETHAWNSIYLYGFWYVVDVTHDDSTYFNGTIYYFYNAGKNMKGVPGKTQYKPIGVFEKYAPDIRYDNLEEGLKYSYIPRYFEVGGNLFFIINDTDEGDGRLALLLEQKTDLKDTVEYRGQKYTITVNSYSDYYGTFDTPVPQKDEEKGFAGFVERLYKVALGRDSEKEGKDFWCENVSNGNLTGADCARYFLCSDEFAARGLSKEEFVEVLYLTFFDRDPYEDPEGFSFWLQSLDTIGRDQVIDGFINSTEWCNVCASYGVRSGAVSAKATVASDNAVKFATRLYTECLGREPEEDGLNYWSLGLTNLELTGTRAAREFFYCPEFTGFNPDDRDYVTRLYKTFMGREPEDDGLSYWLQELENGMTRDQVFDFFSGCTEFTDICKEYGILR